MKTRLHSSRMCTAHLLPISPSMHCAGGSAPGGCLLLGGVCSQEMSAPGGCLLPGDVCSWGGVSAPTFDMGVPASDPGGVYPSMQWGRPPLSTESQTSVKM